MSPSPLLRSDATPAQGALAPSKASALRDQQARQTSPSFDEVLLSSLTTGLETTGKVAVKTPASTPARKSASDVKDAPAELATAITLTLVALDGNSIKTAAAGQHPGRRADPPASLSDASQAAAFEALAPDSAVVPDSAAAAGGKHRPGVRLAPAVTASAAAATKAKTPSSSPDNLVSTLTAATATGAVQAPATGSGKEDRSVHGTAGSADSRYPTVAMNADSTAALANSKLLAAPDRAAADGTKQLPGLRVEPAMTTSQVEPAMTTSQVDPAMTTSQVDPAMTTSQAATAAETIDARPAGVGPDRGVLVTAAAPSAALEAGLASPAGQQLAGQATLPARLAAASDNPALQSAAENSAAQLSAAASTTVVASAMLPIDAHAQPEWRLPQSPTRIGAGITASENSSLAATTPREAMTVKAELLSASTDNTQPGLANAPAAALKSGPRPLPGSSDETGQSVPPAEPAGSNLPPATALAAGTLANQTPGFDSGTPGADAFGASAPSLLHPLPPAPGLTGHAAANSSASLPSTPRLSPEVGSKEWNQALGQQVVQLGKAGQQVTELQLNPPGLGPMQVTLHLNQHQMQVMFVSAHASVRAAVEAAMPQLRASLADSGISLGQTSVSSESQAQGAFAQHQNGASRQQAYRNHSLPEAAAVSARTLAGARRGSDGRGVDTYA